MSELESTSFPLTLEQLNKQLLKALEARSLQDFHKLLCKRIKSVWRMPQVMLGVQLFLKMEKFPNKHGKLWSVYRLMLVCDLFSIAELLYLDSASLGEYVDRFFGVVHWTADDPVKMAKDLLEVKYYGTVVEEELAELLSKHIEVKEDSMSKLLTVYHRVIDSYVGMKKHVDRLRIVLLQKHMEQGFTTCTMENSESRFVNTYFRSSQSFMQQGRYLMLVLKAGDDGLSAIRIYEGESNNLGPEQIQEAQKRMLTSLQNIMKTLASKSAIISKFDEFARLVHVISEIQIQDQGQFLQLINLLKFIIVRVLFYDCKIRQNEIDVFGNLTSIQLIEERSLRELWKRLHKQISELQEALKIGELCMLDGFSMTELCHISKDQEQKRNFTVKAVFEQQILEKSGRIKMIFDEVDLLMVSWICQNWFSAVKLTEGERLLLLGRTKAGKSSLLNFLTESDKEIVGTTLLSGTFFPSKVMIPPPAGINKAHIEAWDLPGLFDTNGKIFKLCVGFFLKTLTSYSTIRIWYVIKNYHFMNDRNEYGDFVFFMGQLLQWNPDNVNCLTFIFSYTAEESEKRAEKAFKRFFEESLENKSMEELEQVYAHINKKAGGGHHVKEFQSALRSRLKVSHGFFFQNDVNKKELEEKESSDSEDDESPEKLKQRKDESRQSLLMKMHEIQPIDEKKEEKKKKKDEKKKQQVLCIRIKLDIQPLTFVKQEREFFNSFKIIDQCEKYLALSNPNEDNEMFLKLYRSIRTFMKIREELVGDLYNKNRKVLRQEYKKIQKQFKDLNAVVENLKRENKADPFLPLVESWLDIFFQWGANESQVDPRKKQKYIRKLKEYLELTSFRREGGLKNILHSPTDAEIRDLAIDLLDCKEMKFPISRQVVERQYSSRWLEKATENSDAHHNLLQLLRDLWEKSTFNEIQLLSVEHYLVTNSQNNQRSGITLNNKLKNLNILNVKNGFELLRLNYHGEGTYGDIRFGEFLELNAIVDEDGIFELTHPRPIRIFCRNVIFDRQYFSIRVQDSLSIVCETFDVDCQKCTLEVKRSGSRQKQEFATIIVKSMKPCPEAEERLIIKPGIVDQDLRIADKDVPRDRKNQRIQKIVEKGRVVTRAANYDGTYAERIVYEPPISLLGKNMKKNNRYSILIHTASTNKLMEFGSLYLEKQVIEELKSNHTSSKPIDQMFVEGCRTICSEIVQFIIECFSDTAIRMSEEHFDQIACGKMKHVLVNFYKSHNLDKPSNKKLTDIKGNCYQIIRQLIFNETFEQIRSNLRQMYRQHGFSKGTVARKLQDDQNIIKKFCDCLLTEPMERVHNNPSNQQMMRFAKHFTRQFQNKARIRITKFEVKRVFKAIFRFVVNTSTYLDNIKKFDIDSSYAETTILNLEKEYARLMEIKMEKEQMKGDKPSDSMNRSKIIDSDTAKSTVAPDSIKQMQGMWRNRSFSDFIRVFEAISKHNRDLLEDSCKIMVAYVYIRLNSFAKARSLLDQISHESLDPQYIRLNRMLTILEAKYESFFVRALKMNQSELYMQDCEKETISYMYMPYTPEQVQHSTIRFEQRYDRKAQSTMNVLSFDSAGYGNGIVNVLFAAELEKLTHRPILHMFDMICGKNESSFLASALAIHKRGEKSRQFSSSFKPEFQALQLIPQYERTLKKLDNMPELQKIRFKELRMKDLIVQLALVIDFDKAECFSTFEAKRSKDTVYDIVMDAVGQRKSHSINPNPLQDVWRGFQKTPAFKDYERFQVLSFGTGIHERNRQDDNKIFNPNQENVNVERWQLYIDDSFDLSEQSQLFYWDQARVFMEEKWLGGWNTGTSTNEQQTKKMRQLIDRLEDRPYLQQLVNCYP